VQALTEFAPRGDVLELAVGTGIWTKHLAASAERCTVLDSSEKTLETLKPRLALFGSRVQYIHADIFRWVPRTRYDVVFFGYWLSHVPPKFFDRFWDLVRSALKENGRVFFVDSLTVNSPLVHYGSVDPATSVQVRKMQDGRELRVYKVFYEPDRLRSSLQDLGWDATVRTTAKHFLYGMASPLPLPGESLQNLG
jgi:demethylmenaquinone methyltransferase/2-methoxy-6-polyprenyl-1,4-benzoquinol methylase